MTAVEKFTAMGFPVAAPLAKHAGVETITLDGLTDPHVCIGNSVHVVLTAVTLLVALACVKKGGAPRPPLPPPRQGPDDDAEDGVAADPPATAFPTRADLKGLPDSIKYDGRSKAFKVVFRGLEERRFKVVHWDSWPMAQEAALNDLKALDIRLSELTALSLQDLRAECSMLGKEGGLGRLTKVQAAEFIMAATVGAPTDGPLATPAASAPAVARLSAPRSITFTILSVFVHIRFSRYFFRSHVYTHTDPS
jgi:hypothetical protein